MYVSGIRARVGLPWTFAWISQFPHAQHAFHRTWCGFVHKQTVHQASESPMHSGTHSHRAPRRTGPGHTLPSKTESSPRARQASSVAMPTFHTVLLSNSPRKHTQAFSLSHHMPRGQTKRKETSFLPASPVTPTLADRDWSRSATGPERASEGTPPEPYRRKKQSTLLLSLGSACGY